MGRRPKRHRDRRPLRTTAQNTAAAAREAGYTVVAVHPLSHAEWFDEYYTRLAERLDVAPPFAAIRFRPNVQDLRGGLNLLHPCKNGLTFAFGY
jgi:hypothetical protein